MAGHHNHFAPVIGERIVEGEAGSFHSRQPVQTLPPSGDKAPAASAACKWPAVVFNEITTRPSVRYPKFWCSSLLRLRASMVAPATNTTDKAACTISSALRANPEWSVVLRPEPRKASTGSVRVANQAGAAPKIDSRQERHCESERQHDGRWQRVDGEKMRAAERQHQQQPRGRHWQPADQPRLRRLPAECSRRSACTMICRRLAPTAIRRAVCVRRATARASSRFATFAQAISRTIPQTASRIWRLRPYSSFISATPAPAGTTLITCFGSKRSMSDIQLEG